MNGQRFHQQKRIEMKTEQCERSLNFLSLTFPLFQTFMFFFLADHVRQYCVMRLIIIYSKNYDFMLNFHSKFDLDSLSFSYHPRKRITVWSNYDFMLNFRSTFGFFISLVWPCHHIGLAQVVIYKKERDDLSRTVPH